MKLYFLHICFKARAGAPLCNPVLHKHFVSVSSPGLNTQDSVSTCACKDRVRILHWWTALYQTFASLNLVIGSRWLCPWFIDEATAPQRHWDQKADRLIPSLGFYHHSSVWFWVIRDSHSHLSSDARMCSTFSTWECWRKRLHPVPMLSPTPFPFLWHCPSHIISVQECMGSHAQKCAHTHKHTHTHTSSLSHTHKHTQPLLT